MKCYAYNLVAIACVGLLLSLFASCSSSRSEPKETVVNGVPVPTLLPREGNLGTPDETALIRGQYDQSIAALKARNSDPKPLLELASVYILEGRITGNGVYYGNAAVLMLDRVLDAEQSTQDQRFQAYSLKSAVLLNLHQFKQALEVADQGLALNNASAGIYGARVDANVELGHYAEAVQDCDRMLSIRPDLRSYSRASYLRQIHGDNAGAIEAMKMAVAAGVPGAEATEWARVTLGDLYLNAGKVDSASLSYRTALVYRPEYPHGVMGLARVERANGRLDAAIGHARTAIKSLSEVSFIAYLGDLYELKGDAAAAAKVRQDVVRLLEDGEKEQPEDAPVKHNASRELATAYLHAGNFEKALGYARKDWEQRQDNIDANELMATICYRKGDLPAARMHAEKSMAMQTRNAASLYQAGTILAAAGDERRGEELKKEALKVSPWLADSRPIAGRP